MMARSGRMRGFTLLEVLVALAVLSLALMAAMKGSGEVINNSTRLKERTLAHWVAMNRAAELELAPTWPELGSSRGRATMANREWLWSVHTEKTPDPDIRHAAVAVGLREADAPLATLELFLARP